MNKILVIEDNVDFGLTLCAVLNDSGYDTTHALNGFVGLSKFKDNSYDLVIVDIFMPEKDGLETIQELRANFPETKIIAISGGGKYGNFDYLICSIEFGADLSIEKPFDNEVILKAVKDLLNR